MFRGLSRWKGASWLVEINWGREQNQTYPYEVNVCEVSAITHGNRLRATSIEGIRFGLWI
jgi:hypothetical protein